MNCKIICDKFERLAQAKKRFDIPYPDELRKNIIHRNMNLLCDAMPAYSHQISKAASRNDRVSVNHRAAAFLESYFDVIFALNRQLHPGEKRLMQICMQKCNILPDNFEKNLNKLFDDMSRNSGEVDDDIKKIVFEIKKVL